ncbi:MAG: peroxidase family protein [Thiothrix sp.]
MQTIDNRALSQGSRYGQVTSTGSSNGSTRNTTTQNNSSLNKQGGYNGGFGQGSEEIMNIIQGLLGQFEGKGSGNGSGGNTNTGYNKPAGNNSGSSNTNTGWNNGNSGWGNNGGWNNGKSCWGNNTGNSTKPKPGEYRSIDGTGNNLKNPELGSADQAEIRIMPVDTSREPGGTTFNNLPSPREVSNAVSAQEGSTTNSKGLSDMFWVWGQFLDHDITLVHTTADEYENIAIPSPDPYFDPNGTGTATMGFTRSAYELDANGQRQQINSITSFIDGSNVYGSDEATADSLRAHEGGKMVMNDGELMPEDTTGQYMAGDVRANENPALTSMHTLWVREHNRIADELAQQHPEWSDEQLYQEARKTNVAQIQAITYNEFLPALVGEDAIADYKGYDPNVDPTISNEFAAAIYRLGHTMLSPNLLRLDENGETIPEGNLALRDSFFNPSAVSEAGIDPILRGAATQTAQAVDTMIVDDVRNFLFGQPGEGGFDLASLNIQRGRDHGLPGYNDAREAMGLSRIESFDDPIWRDGVGAKLAQVYDSPDDVDLWVAGLAEKETGDSLVGELSTAVLVDQFTRLRDGDRFWYENQFSGQQLRELNNLQLSDIIKRNTDIQNIQDEVMVAPTANQGNQPTTPPTQQPGQHGTGSGNTPYNSTFPGFNRGGSQTNGAFPGFNRGGSQTNGAFPSMMQNSFFMLNPQQIFNFQQAFWKGHLG